MFFLFTFRRYSYSQSSNTGYDDCVLNSPGRVVKESRCPRPSAGVRCRPIDRRPDRSLPRTPPTDRSQQSSHDAPTDKRWTRRGRDVESPAEDTHRFKLYQCDKCDKFFAKIMCKPIKENAKQKTSLRLELKMAEH